MVKDKIKLIDDLYLSNQNALDLSTKSFAGDKHETFRAIIHLVQEKLFSQLLELNKSLRILSQIDIVERSSLNMVHYLVQIIQFFTFQLTKGKVSINGTNLFIMSPVSTLFQRLIGLDSMIALNLMGSLIIFYSYVN